MPKYKIRNKFVIIIIIKIAVLYDYTFNITTVTDILNEGVI